MLRLMLLLSLLFLTACTLSPVQATPPLQPVSGAATATTIPPTSQKESENGGNVVSETDQAAAEPSPSSEPSPPAVTAVTPEAYRLDGGQLRRYDANTGQYVEVVAADSEQSDINTGYEVYFSDDKPVALVIGNTEVFADTNGLFKLDTDFYFWQGEQGLQKMKPLDESVRFANYKWPVKEMAGYQVDGDLGLLSAVDAEGRELAFYVPQIEGGRWVTNPLVDNCRPS